jgi:hypothetical protein
MDVFDFMASVHDAMQEISRDPYNEGPKLSRDAGFIAWPNLDMAEVERVGAELAKLFGIKVDVSHPDTPETLENQG